MRVRWSTLPPSWQLFARCTRAALHWSLSSKYVCVCVYSAVGSHQQGTWMAGSHPPSMRMRGCVPPARAPPRTMPVCAACLGAGALPHTLQQRCSCVKCISVPRLCCRYVSCVRHTHLLGQHHHHVAGVHVAGVAGPRAASLLQCSWVPTTCKSLYCFVEAYQDWVCSNAFIRAEVWWSMYRGGLVTVFWT